MAVLNTTSADAELLLTVNGLYPAPVKIQGFMPDQMWSTDAVDNAEDSIGADGKMSAGWVPAIIPFTISLQAGSPSHAIFELIYATEQATRSKLTLGGALWLPSAQRVYTLSNGIMKNLKVLPDGGKVLQGRPYVTHWEAITSAPV